MWKIGRGATKAVGNVWYEARKNAAKYNEKLESREGAAEALGTSIDVIRDTECGLYKCMPPDNAILMADLYNAPHLLNYYCKHECPIGRNMDISDERVDIPQAVCRLSVDLKNAEQIKDKLMQIAYEGRKDPIELSKLYEGLGKLSETISEIKTCFNLI